jgi:hypothetical protein
MISDLSTKGLLDGITALTVVLLGALFASIMYFRARKLDAKLLKHGALMGLFSVFLWMGPALDFLSMVFTGQNLEPRWLYGIISYMWVAPAIIMAMYTGSEIMVPEKKKLIVCIYIVIGVIFEILLFIDGFYFQGENTFKFQNKAAGDLIDVSFQYFSPTFFLIAFFLVSVFIFDGLGALIKAFQSTGVIRTRLLFLSFTFFLFVIVAIFDAYFTIEIIYIFRLLMILCAITMYQSLKPRSD